MIVTLAKHRPLPNGRALAAPLDFYRFRHRSEIVEGIVGGRVRVIDLPSWIVGVSPFDPVLGEDEGLVVHLAAPRFTARWTMREDTLAALPATDYVDEDLGIALYDIMRLDKDGDDPSAWLLEAVCAIAYSKGLIAVADPVETH